LVEGEHFFTERGQVLSTAPQEEVAGGAKEEVSEVSKNQTKLSGLRSHPPYGETSETPITTERRRNLFLFSVGSVNQKNNH